MTDARKNLRKKNKKASPVTRVSGQLGRCTSHHERATVVVGIQKGILFISVSNDKPLLTKNDSERSSVNSIYLIYKYKSCHFSFGGIFLVDIVVRNYLK